MWNRILINLAPSTLRPSSEINLPLSFPPKILQFIATIFITFLSLHCANALSPEFPIKGNVERRVNFWIKVYTEITTQEAFLHDSEDLSIVYKKVSLPKNRRKRRRYLKGQRNHYKKLLRSMAKSKPEQYNEDQKKLFEIIGPQSPNNLRQMARNLRFQYGLKDRYLKGLKRSYQYMPFIEQEIEAANLPEELKFLPHVESSFNPHAYSKVGAAGMWQFMRATARLYRLKIGYTVDERRDPFKATKGALRLLKDNYRLLDSWPLALTAYNHGARSMQRAIRKLGTTDIHTIIENYRGRRFGFASKNFYATFMATVLISSQPEKYFPNFKAPKALDLKPIVLPKALSITEILGATQVSKFQFKEYNPSIRRSAYSMSLPLPKGHTIYIPNRSGLNVAQIHKKLEALETSTPQGDAQRLHIVSRGENLFEISQYYRVNMRDLVIFNRLSDPSRIYAGMKLKIPGKKTKIIPEPVLVAKKEMPKVGPSLESLDSRDTTKKEAKVSPAPLYGPFPPLTAPKLEGYELETKKVKKNTYEIIVETDETLGHYAEWLQVKTQKIRQWNSLAFGRVILMGQKIRLYMDDETKLRFTQERNSYHLSIQEDFFENYSVASEKTYTVRRGDTLTQILKEVELPYWLVRRQQQDQKLSHNLMVGQKITLPVLEALNQGDNMAPTDSLSEEDEQEEEK